MVIVAAPKGNRFWEVRSSHGRKPKFKTAEDLWDACQEYFEWVEDNPLETSELVKFQGNATVAVLPKMRAMTLKGLCRFLDVDYVTWLDWKERRKDLTHIISRVEDIVYEQKFTGASADLLNANIIARDLGLAERNKVDADIVISRDPSELSDEELANIATGGSAAPSKT